MEVVSTENSSNGPAVGLPDAEVPVEFVANYKVLKEKLKVKSKLDNAQVQSQLDQLYTGCLEIYNYAHEYDYSPSLKFNGFRTFLKVVFIYFDQIALYARIIRSQLAMVQQKQIVHNLNKFIDALPLWLHQLTSLKLIRRQKFVKPDATQIDCPETLPLELEILKHHMNLSESDVEPFFDSPVFGFWLPNSVRRLMVNLEKLFSLVLFPSYQGLPALCSRKKLAALQANRCINDSAHEAKIVKKLTINFGKIICPESIYKVDKFFFTQRQTKWTIDTESKLVVQSVDEAKKPKIRLVIIKPKTRRTENVIFQIHGGGWTIGQPEMHFHQFGHWVEAIGATIVSIDYSLAPENKYPTALQEILDTYLWLSEAKGDQLEPLEFVPKDIVVTGDSAGGNLTLSLAIVLAEIEKQSPGTIKFPKALAPEYPAASPGLPYITASSILMDILIPETLRVKHIASYYPGCPCEPEVSYLGGKNDPWFKDEEKLVNFYKHLHGNRKADQIFHIISYQSFRLLKHIPLYIQGAEFDPLIDDSIAIAKLWQGPVTFDIYPNVLHGFSMFAEKSPECKLADQIVTRRLKEAVEN